MIEFLKTKNNKLSAEINHIKLHSVYNPDVEAERFVENIKIDFNPSQIIIIEPCLSYVLPFLKNRFSNVQLIAVRFSEDFTEFNSDWDKIIYFKDEINFKNELSKIDDFKICSTLFLQWEITKRIFPTETDKVWKLIKEKINYSKTILYTQTFFSKRWFINKINFIKFANNLYTITKSDQNILIVASGFSLEKSIEKIKKIRNSFFIISLSSATQHLIKNNIFPDLVLSTDGGFYSKKHLEILEKFDIPLAIPFEANCPKTILSKNKIIPLSYAKDFNSEEKIEDFLKIPYLIAERNGTVSGTAVNLALQLTKSNIFFTGLDLSSSASFQHARPNALEIEKYLQESKINTLQTQLSKQMFNSESLKIYENWFIENSKKFNNRVFRLSDNYNYKNSLGNIKDINFDDLSKFLKDSSSKMEIKKLNFEKEENQKEKILNFLKKELKKQEIIKNLFPLDVLQFQKLQNQEEKLKKQEKINLKIQNLINSTEKIL